MSTNPYQAPTSDITLEGDVDNTGNDFLYRVSAKKFWILFISTLGMYTLYWSYKNWAIAKKNHDLSIWPVMRAIFQIFFLHSLMRRVKTTAKSNNIVLRYPCGQYATLAVILIISEKILDRVIRLDIGFPYTDIASILIVFVLAYVFWLMQHVINIASGDIDGSANSTFSVGNIIWIVIGSILWLVVFYSWYLIFTE